MSLSAKNPNTSQPKPSVATQAASPSVSRQPPLAVTFQELAERWRAETSYLSSVNEMVLHPAYQRIIGLGPAVVPLLLAELERSLDHWFWALNAITGN